MVVKRREGDLCTAYRPQTFSDVVGQRAIVKSIKKSILSPNHSQCFLFHGESGCGKTTLARVVAMALNCDDRKDTGDPCCVCDSCLNIASDSHPDYKEIDAADAGGIDQIRRIKSDLSSKPMFGKVKMYVLDEAHKMSAPAQEALLKGTEDMPEGIYVILCSTAPAKIIKTLKNRCEDYKFKLLSNKDIMYLISVVSIIEGKDLGDYDSIITETLLDVAAGRPRNALKALQKALNIIDEPTSDILQVIGFIDEAEKNVIDLCKVLTATNRPLWGSLMKMYKAVNAEPETVRIVLAGWFRTMLERSSNAYVASRAAQALDLFLYDPPLIKPENRLVLSLYRAFILFGAK